jgi:hypothetical protein
LLPLPLHEAKRPQIFLGVTQKLTLILYRNGSKSSIKEIVDNLNNADLDKNAGTSFFCSPAPRIIPASQQNPSLLLLERH